MIKTALLAGAFGYGNLGDNLLRDIALKMLGERFPEIQFFVDRPYPDQELSDSVDLRIIGPGGLLYDSDSGHEEYFKTYLKKPFILMGIGLQGVEHVKLNGLTAQACRGADLIITRHLDDLPIIESLRGNFNGVHAYPDFGYLFKPAYRMPVKRIFSHAPMVTLCPVGNVEIPENFWQGVTNLVSFSILDDPRTEKLARRVKPERTTVEHYFDTPDYLYNVIAGSDLLITGRYHAAVLANLAGVQVVSLTDNRKIRLETRKQIDWQQLIKNPSEYIRMLPPISVTSSRHRLEEIRAGKIDPLVPVVEYLNRF